MKKILAAMMMVAAFITHEANAQSNDSNSNSTSGSAATSNAVGNIGNTSNNNPTSTSTSTSTNNTSSNSSAGSNASNAGNSQSITFTSPPVSTQNTNLSGTTTQNQVLSGGTNSTVTTNGTQTVNQNLSGTQTVNQNLSGTTTQNTNLSGSTTANVNTSGTTTSNVNMNQSGTSTQNVNTTNTISGEQTQHIDYTGTQTIKNVPSVNGPPLTTSNDTCMGSTSGSINGPGFGIGLGSTWRDQNCIMLKNARELWNMGMKAASMELMCSDEANRRALEATGFVCGGTVVQRAAQAEATENEQLKKRIAAMEAERAIATAPVPPGLLMEPKVAKEDPKTKEPDVIITRVADHPVLERLPVADPNTANEGSVIVRRVDQ